MLIFTENFSLIFIAEETVSPSNWSLEDVLEQKGRLSSHLPLLQVILLRPETRHQVTVSQRHVKGGSRCLYL